MTKAFSSDHPYNGRRPDTVVLNCCLHREAATLLREYAGGGRKLGAFVSRLIYEHHTRQVGPNIEKLLWSASKQDFAVKAYFRRS